MDFAIAISDKDMKRVLKDLKDYDNLVAKQIQGAIVRATYRVGGRTRQNAPVNFGRLRQSIREKIRPLRGEISVNVAYAGAVELGSIPHPITPKSKKALAFKPGAGFRFWNESGRVVVKSVQHPGTKAQPFLGPAMEAEVPIITKRIKKIIEDSAKRNSG